MDDAILELTMILLIVALGIFLFKRMSSMKPTETKAASQPKRTDTTQLVEDIKMTQTSRIVDAIAVMDDMAETSNASNYRHYCELIGKSMGSNGVIAPYSRREVAYYDLRCYRIENRNGRDVETLVAHEKSIDPFYFTDSSGDDRVYVDLDTFGNNCILVNATNRVEGPNSDFSKAFNQASDQNTGRSSAYAMASRVVRAGHNVLAGAAQGLASVLAPRSGLQPAYVTTAGTRTIVDIPASALNSNIMFDRDDFDERSKRSFYGGGFGGVPSDLDIFLGGAFSSGSFGGYGGPKIRPGGDMGSLIGIGLGALLTTLANSSSQTSSGRPPYEQQSSFRGYRLIEDVVPLNSPIYCIGEIYRHDSDIHMGRSVSSSYPSSYFAVKQEAEVINALK